MCTNSSSESVTSQKLQFSPSAESPAETPPSRSSPPSVMPAAAPLNLAVTSQPMNPLEQYRLQLYNYALAERFRCSQQYPANPFGGSSYAMTPYGPRLALHMSLFQNRMFAPEEPKPQHSYIGLIAMAIQGHPEQKMVLSDIYQWILDNYSYFRNRGPGWRNSIRHNLSLNDCFVKSGRSANGKGHYWAIHPANVEDFKKGDFRRRKAQRKVRKHMGLSVDDDGTDSPSPPPLTITPPPLGFIPWAAAAAPVYAAVAQSRKRQFDVASLLAPDDSADLLRPPAKKFAPEEEDIDVVASEDEKDSETCLPPDSSSAPDNNNSPPWQGLWTMRGNLDPRVLGYYGQYFAARRLSVSHHHHPHHAHSGSSQDEQLPSSET